ncbi:hypothetical protein JAO29_11010 [Edaphobacter sp. HDX4]|uniref:hypothetical protein n=1 Tax=Edaphobacter sp. HDX4 TaxID=2794064 RepID=UPI002FE54BF6
MFMNLNRAVASFVAASMFSLPVHAMVQVYPMVQQATQAEHDRAEHEQTAQDHRKHTGAKVVGGTAAGGAVVGALAGGGKGALIGGAAGAGAGAIANKVRKDKAVKKRERRETEQPEYTNPR